MTSRHHHQPPRASRGASWLHDIKALQTFSNSLKASVAAALQEGVSPAYLPVLDAFHTQVLNLDAAINLLRHDAAVLPWPGTEPAPGRLERDIAAATTAATGLGVRWEALQDEMAAHPTPVQTAEPATDTAAAAA